VASANDLGRPASAVSFAFQLLVVTTSAGGAISESCVGRLDGGGLHRVCVLRQDEPVGDTTVERSVPPAEIRLPLGVELMQLRSGKRTATRGGDSWMLPRCSPVGTAKSGSRMPRSALPQCSRPIVGRSADSNSMRACGGGPGPAPSHLLKWRSAARIRGIAQDVGFLGLVHA
jgi:hypothetical protein